MSFLDPRVWAAIVLACAMSYGAGRWQQWRSSEKEHAAALLKAALAAQQVEQNLRDDMEVLDEVRTKELLVVAAARDRAMRELRHRPERLPEASRAACAGSSGAELSREDSETAVGIGHDAQQVVIELRACEARERATFEALKGPAAMGAE